jgi:uncharacterized membrane protein YfcA
MFVAGKRSVHSCGAFDLRDRKRNQVQRFECDRSKPLQNCHRSTNPAGFVLLAFGGGSMNARELNGKTAKLEAVRPGESSANYKPLPRFDLLVVAACVWGLLQAGSFGWSIVAHRPSAWVDVAIAAVVLISATVSSIAGFAFAALAGIGLAFMSLDPVRAVHTIVLCSIATQLYAVWQLRRNIQWLALWPMLATGALTVPFGVWLLLHAQTAMYRIGLGVLLIGYGAYSIGRSEEWKVRVSRSRDALAGALGGFIGGLTAFPGMLITIWCSLRGSDKVGQRAIYQPYILAMQLVTLASLHILGRGHLGDGQDLRYVIFAILGAAAGFALFKRMSATQFRVALNVLLVVSGFGLLVAAVGIPGTPLHAQ